MLDVDFLKSFELLVLVEIRMPKKPLHSPLPLFELLRDDEDDEDRLVNPNRTLDILFLF